MITNPDVMTAAAADLATISSKSRSAAHLSGPVHYRASSRRRYVRCPPESPSCSPTTAAPSRSSAAKTTAFHDQFVHTLKSGATGYSTTEAAAITSLRPLLDLLPSWLNNALTTAGLYVAGFLVGAIVIGYFVLAWLISLPAGLLGAGAVQA